MPMVAPKKKGTKPFIVERNPLGFIIKKKLAKEFQTKDYRGCLIKAIDKHRVTLNKCNMRDLFYAYKILRSKIGISNTIIVVGKLKYNDQSLSPHLQERLKESNNMVVLKIAEDGVSSFNGLYIEREVYTKIINKLYFYNYTPHVILSYGSYTCGYNNFVKHLPQKDQVYFDKFSVKKRRLNILSTEYSDGITLKEWMMTRKPRYQDILSVLFQIIYTIQVFQLFGLKHNDLHWQNILIEKVKKTNYIYIVSEQTYFEVPVKYLAKIFDFDTATVNKVHNIDAKKLKTENIQLINSRLDFSDHCKDYGICNDPNPKFDLFTVLGMMYDTSFYNKRVGEKLRKFLLKLASSKLFLTQWGHTYRLCKLVDNQCDGNFIPTDNQLLTPLASLFEFRDYERNVKDYPKEYDPEFYPYVYYLLPGLDRRTI